MASPATGLVQINSAHVKGEPGTGFEKAGDKGEFECGNCNFFDGQSCGQEDMMRLSKQPKLPNGRISVDEEDCCEYVDRKGGKPAQQSGGEAPGMAARLKQAMASRRQGGSSGAGGNQGGGSY